MIVTEEEAKTKRCQESFNGQVTTPQGHVISITDPGNSHSLQYGAGCAVATSPSMCIGSACMAWRWKCEAMFIPMDGSDTKLVERAEYSTTHGYCGKAGKP